MHSPESDAIIRLGINRSDAVTVGARLEQIRSNLGLTQAEMGARIGLPLRTYTRYASGERSPSAEALQALVQIGINLNWLMSGEGQMRPGGAEAPPPAPTSAAVALDPELYGRVTEAVSMVYKECGYTLALHQVAAEAARIAADLSADGLTPEERPGAIKGAVGQLRRRLREAIANPNSAAAGTQKA